MRAAAVAPRFARGARGLLCWRGMERYRAFLLPGIAALLLLAYYGWRWASPEAESAPPAPAPTATDAKAKPPAPTEPGE